MLAILFQELYQLNSPQIVKNDLINKVRSWASALIRRAKAQLQTSFNGVSVNIWLNRRSLVRKC
jgi:hypothetical protein